MKILFRADANKQIGTGHVMRTLALAESCLQHGFDVHFAYSECPNILLTRWNESKASTHKIAPFPGFKDDANAVLDIFKDTPFDWIIIDGHHFGDTYQKILKSAQQRILVFDDYGHTQHTIADIVINQNASAEESLYRSRNNYSKLLLGPEYAILRQEFRLRKLKHREMNRLPSNLLLTTGGSDPENASVQILKGILAIKELWPLKIRIVAGSLNPNTEELREIASKTQHHSIEIFDHVDTMVGHMGWADVAISGGGTTLQELLQQGVPTVTFSLVQNQTRNAMCYDRKFQACSFFGLIEEFNQKDFSERFELWIQDIQKLNTLSALGLKTVDGKGVARVIEHLQCLP